MIEPAPISAPIPLPEEPQADADTDTAVEPVPVSEPTGAPARIQIPSIGVNALVEQVGLTAEGAMGVPRDPQNTAWYAFGPRPGDVGSAAIAGHVDWFGGASAVFTDLHNLKAGDVITVVNDLGESVNFTVREIKLFDALADATEVFVSNDGSAHLNLITCDGVWNQETQQYSERLVVFADEMDWE